MSGDRKNGAGKNGKLNGSLAGLSLGYVPTKPAASNGDRPLDAAAALRGRTLLVTGATGFVGKVTLSMLLHRYPEIGRVFVLIRPGTGGTADARFFGKVVGARPFDPLRAQHGARFESFMRTRCTPIAGDVSDPLLGLTEESLADIGRLDLVLNCAGLVDFNPSLELALNVNVRGAQHAVDVCKATGAALVHVSTCFVAGNRSGVIFEDEPIVGYFPRREGVEGRPTAGTLDARDFDLDREIADCDRRIARIREDAEDTALRSEFRERARARLEAEGRANGEERAERLALGRERRLWISQRLVELGMGRANHWGWPNTYTYTKSLGEQSIARSEIDYALVRPSIVETALRYPFPGWNEGFTTSAPLCFLGLKGQRVYPMAERAILDIVPVDLVASATIAAAADLLDGRTGDAPRERKQRVFHVASSDSNPLYVRRALELVGLARRRFYKEREEGSSLVNRLRAKIEPYPVSRSHYETFGPPAFSALAQGLGKLLRERAPTWGAPRVSALAAQAADKLDEIDRQLSQTKTIFELFMPFTWENRYLFQCKNVREVYARLTPADRQRLPWDPEAISWRDYWLDVHMKGLEEWVFPGLEEESKKKVHTVRQHRDLLELLHATCSNHATRVALRMTGGWKSTFTYAELRTFSERVAGFLAARGVQRGDRVLLASENRPEWAIAFFGILLAGATAVPVDPQLSAAELENLARSARARLALLSDDVTDRVPDLLRTWVDGGEGPSPASIADAMSGDSARAPRPSVQADDVASLLFTSGTTGTPKGVMLTHRNFTSLVAKLSNVFSIGPGDGLLSVLPLHHTFEFTCGLLVPLSRGCEIEYLDELTADTIGDALETGRITGMIGVPALWSLLHRRITQELSAAPGVVEKTLQALMRGNARLRDEWGANLGKLLFWPVHRKFGGRLRILVSGGSALSSEVHEAFHELGFDLYEGYGLTEAAPVLSVSTPEDGSAPGSIGKPLPGIDIRIDAPDENGIGEVLARGPNVMLGYRRAGADGMEVDPDLTDRVVTDGWLRTGDLGKLDDSGRLVLVGRKKDVIIDADGRNVYPDELEELYRSDDLVSELSIVGVPDERGEKIGMLIVPAWKDRDRAEVRRLLEDHVRKVSGALPFYKRVKVWHPTDRELPRTSTRKVKRDWVIEELRRLEAAAHRGARAREAVRSGSGDQWLLDLVAEVSHRPPDSITHRSLLAVELGFDSLMLTELAAALEEAGVGPSATEALHTVQSVGELARLIAQSGHKQDRGRAAADDADEKNPSELVVPSPIAELGRRLLGAGQRALYRDLYKTRIRGSASIPRDRNFLVVANHSSHLDMGLVKVALGDQGDRLAALAARDYFFDTPLKRAYFENFTNLIPMERSGSVRKGLHAAVEVLRRGMSLLVFPEGTRTRDGTIAEFKPTAGYLALHCGVDTLPVYIRGTYEAFPPGAVVPRNADLEVVIGEPIRIAELRRKTGHLPKGDAHKMATRIMEQAVRALAGTSAEERRAPAPTTTATALSLTPSAEPQPAPHMLSAPASPEDER